MKALKEIGLKKAVKFIFYSIIEFLLSVCFIPQIRILFLKLLGASIGRNTVILNCSYMNLYRSSFKNLSIGNNCYIGKNALIDLAGKIIIGNHVTVSERAILLSHLNIGFKDNPLQRHYPAKIDKTIVESYTFIGVGSIILSGIHIGSECVIGAGSVVTKNIPSSTVVAGIPAKKIKSLRNE